MRMFDEKEKAFLRKLERKAKKAFLKVQVLLNMREKFIKETIGTRLYYTIGKYISKKTPFECVFNWDDGPENVLIEDIRLPWVYMGKGPLMRFEETLLEYRVKLKSGKWSKHTYSTEADDWALEQIKNHISQSETEAGQG